MVGSEFESPMASLRRLLGKSTRKVIPETVIPKKEVSRDIYLARLSPDDFENIDTLTHFLKDEFMKEAMYHEALIAVGSTVRLPEERDHDPEDIDLRLLNDAPTDTTFRQRTINRLRANIRRFGILHADAREERNHTRIIYPSGFLEFYNYDPSFVLKMRNGLPLHISISGIDNPNMSTYLEEERVRNNTFSLLYDSRTISGNQV